MPKAQARSSQHVSAFFDATDFAFLLSLVRTIELLVECRALPRFKRRRFLEKTNADGVMTRPVWKLVHFADVRRVL